MKIRSAEFIVCATTEKNFPGRILPSLSFVGRSNVGKSSLINKLTNRKKLAQTSSKPGKTRTVNFYLVNDAFYLVDLPGYGYAKLPAKIKKQMMASIGRFVDHWPGLKGFIHVLDIRHPPSRLDIEIDRWLREYEYPQIKVAIKADKVKTNETKRRSRIISDKLEMRPSDRIIPFSAVTGLGKKELWQESRRILEI